MATKGYFTLPRVPKLELHHQLQFSVLHDTEQIDPRFFKMPNSNHHLSDKQIETELSNYNDTLAVFSNGIGILRVMGAVKIHKVIIVCDFHIRDSIQKTDLDY